MISLKCWLLLRTFCCFCLLLKLKWKEKWSKSIQNRLSMDRLVRKNELVLHFQFLMMMIFGWSKWWWWWRGERKDFFRVFFSYCVSSSSHRSIKWRNLIFMMVAHIIIIMGRLYVKKKKNSSTFEYQISSKDLIIVFCSWWRKIIMLTAFEYLFYFLFDYWIYFQEKFLSEQNVYPKDENFTYLSGYSWRSQSMERRKHFLTET